MDARNNPLCVQLNAILQPLRRVLPPGDAMGVGASLTVGNCIVIESWTPASKRTGMILRPQFTIAHRLYEVVVVESPPGGLCGFNGVDPLDLKYSARELCTLVRIHVDRWDREDFAISANPYTHPMIDPATNLLLPGYPLDAEPDWNLQ